MNRKAFLTSIIALFVAPFVKGKEQKPDLKGWIKANPELYQQIVSHSIAGAIATHYGVPAAKAQEYERATFNKVAISERDKEYINEMKVNTAHIREIVYRSARIRYRIK